MSKAFELPKNSKCGECSKSIKKHDLFTIIYEDDDSGKIKHLLCDNCEVDDRIKHYRNTGEVSSHLSLEASMAHYHFTESNDPSMSRIREDVRHFYQKYKKDLLEIAEGNEKIKQVIREFEDKHWLSYLKKYWNDTTIRGHQAKVGKTKLMLWGCAGRVLMTAERDKNSVTMIFTDSDSQITANGGQQGIDCTQKMAQEILQGLVAADKITFKPDKAVRMAGL